MSWAAFCPRRPGFWGHLTGRSRRCCGLDQRSKLLPVETSASSQRWSPGARRCLSHKEKNQLFNIWFTYFMPCGLTYSFSYCGHVDLHCRLKFSQILVIQHSPLLSPGLFILVCWFNFGFPHGFSSEQSMSLIWGDWVYWWLHSTQEWQCASFTNVRLYEQISFRH